MGFAEGLQQFFCTGSCLNKYADEGVNLGGGGGETSHLDHKRVPIPIVQDC